MTKRHWNVGKDNPMFGTHRIGNKSFSHPKASNGNWKGGRITHHGYVYVNCPDHPYADRHGYVMEHRLLMEKKLGRYLWEFEVIHHINGITNDNRIENLELFTTHAEHMTYHAKIRRK